MARTLLAIVLVGAAVAGCAPSGAEKGKAPKGAAAAKERAAVGSRGADVKREGFVGVIKAATLDQLPSRSIGDALGRYRYFQHREWKEARLGDGSRSVDFYGTLADSLLSGEDRARGVRRRTLQVRFQVEGSGAFWIDSITRHDERPGGVESQGIADPGSVLPRIWDNKVVSF